jgi:hypothetical protein
MLFFHCDSTDATLGLLFNPTSHSINTSGTVVTEDEITLSNDGIVVFSSFMLISVKLSIMSELVPFSSDNCSVVTAGRC